MKKDLNQREPIGFEEWEDEFDWKYDFLIIFLWFYDEISLGCEDSR